MIEENSRDEKNQQLLSAYIDRELGPAERALAESLLRSHPRYARLTEQWREIGIELRALPKHQLKDEFVDRVLNKIAQRQ